MSKKEVKAKDEGLSVWVAGFDESDPTIVIRSEDQEAFLSGVLLAALEKAGIVDNIPEFKIKVKKKKGGG
jgi:hypothetical protein